MPNKYFQSYRLLNVYVRRVLANIGDRSNILQSTCLYFINLSTTSTLLNQKTFFSLQKLLASADEQIALGIFLINYSLF